MKAWSCSQATPDRTHRGGVDRRCLREEPHEARHGCVFETRRQAVVRTIREVLNTPDEYEISVGLHFSTPTLTWHITSASMGEFPLGGGPWATCAAAGLPMASWDGDPKERWVRATRERMRDGKAQRYEADLADVHGRTLAAHCGEPQWDDMGSADCAMWIRRAQRLRKRWGVDKHEASLDEMVNSTAAAERRVEAEPVLVAAKTLVASWEAWGTTHPLGAHLYDLRAALTGTQNLRYLHGPHEFHADCGGASVSERDAEFMAWDDPWPTVDVVKNLVKAAVHLLHDHECDTLGWEEIATSCRKAKDRLNAIGMTIGDTIPLSEELRQIIREERDEERKVCADSGSRWRP